MVAAGAIAGSAGGVAADPIATAVGVVPAAVAQLGGQDVAVIQGTELFEGQLLITGATGEIQILFADETRLVIGANSTLVIERYLMTNNGAVGSFAVNALAGTFRFMTGNSPSAAYSLNSPAGTIGIRGTEFDFAYSPLSRLMSVLLYEGAVDICSTTGQCVLLDEPCELGEVGGGAAAIRGGGGDRAAIVDANFPFVDGQNRLQRAFRVAGASACVTAPTVPVPPTNAPPANAAPGPAEPAAAPPAPVEPPPPAAPPPPAEPPPPTPDSGAGNGNNGLGNGGEGAEGPDEAGNPGRGGNGNGNGPPR